MRRGRPPLAADDASVHVHFRLPAKQYDLTQQRADQARISLADWLRQVVTRASRGPAAAKADRRR
jgi:hypothetical protein